MSRMMSCPVSRPAYQPARRLTSRPALRRVATDQRGVALIEATLGTVILLLAALIVIQMVLVFHAVLAAHSAAVRTARTLAIAGSGAVAETYRRQVSTTLAALTWGEPDCRRTDTLATCTVEVRVPAIVPGAGLFADGSVSGRLVYQETGWYPIGDGSGG